jgi:hypothetical protein
MENKALLATLGYKFNSDPVYRPDIYQSLDNITYCSCFYARTHKHYYNGDGIDYLKVNNTVLCIQHMGIYMKKITENRIEKMEKMLETILTGIKHITYRVDRNSFEPEMNNLLGDITSGVRPSEARHNECDKKE